MNKLQTWHIGDLRERLLTLHKRCNESRIQKLGIDMPRGKPCPSDLPLFVFILATIVRIFLLFVIVLVASFRWIRYSSVFASTADALGINVKGR